MWILELVFQGLINMKNDSKSNSNKTYTYEQITINAINLVTHDSKKVLNLTCNYTKKLKNIDKEDCTRVYNGSTFFVLPYA